jgi:hypothetical protein
MLKGFLFFIFLMTAQTALSHEVTLVRRYLEWDAASASNVWRTQTGFHDELPLVRGMDQHVAAAQTSFCFKGKPEAVCAQIQQVADHSYAFYMQGDHWGIYLRSCEVDLEAETVEASYSIIDDYSGDADLTRIIKACE